MNEMAMLAEQFGRLAGVPAFEGQDGMSVSPGAIYGDALLNGPVAPGERVDQSEIDRLFAGFTGYAPSFSEASRRAVAAMQPAARRRRTKSKAT